jgi:hypothetical protein
MVHLMKEMFSGMGTRQSLEAMTENKLWRGGAWTTAPLYQTI